VKKEALTLADAERVELVLALMETLPMPQMEVSDEEVSRRDAEAQSGDVDLLSPDEFVHRVQENRWK
jgi:hypothetical protein